MSRIHWTPFQKALIRGMRGQCPDCGKGDLFSTFLKVVDKCGTCNEEYHYHRADDFPAYLVVVLVGHVIATLVLVTEVNHPLAPWIELAIFLPLTLILCLALLQPMKGAVVALQWHLGMHGFQKAAKSGT